MFNIKRRFLVRLALMLEMAVYVWVIVKLVTIPINIFDRFKWHVADRNYILFTGLAGIIISVPPTP